jgi:hypothetical protein
VLSLRINSDSPVASRNIVFSSSTLFRPSSFARTICCRHQRLQIWLRLPRHSQHQNSLLLAAETTQNRSRCRRIDNAAARRWPPRPQSKHPRADTQTLHRRSAQITRRPTAPQSVTTSQRLCSMRSPARWPYLSLMYLKWSRSNEMSATVCLSRRDQALGCEL